MIKKHFWKMPLLLAVCGLAFALTGCGGTSNPRDVIGNGNNGDTPSWPPSAGLWCNESQEQVEGFTAITSDNFSAAVAHVNTNPGAFTLAIGEDISTLGSTLNADNAHLTVVGIGGEQEIRAISSRIFTVGPDAAVEGSSMSLTLGNNITLVGRSYSNHGTMDLVLVRNHGRLYMEDGSRITDHVNSGSSTGNGFGAAVNLEAYGTFTMRGGEITGNRATSENPAFAGGVSANYATSRFYMKGGRIHGNTRGANGDRADIRINRGMVSLSGEAEVYRVILTYAANDSSLTIGSGWSGTVYSLDLMGGGTTQAVLNTTIANWTDNAVLRAAPSHTLIHADVARIASSRFVVGNAAAGVSLTQDLYPSHEIVIEGNKGVVALMGNGD